MISSDFNTHSWLADWLEFHFAQMCCGLPFQATWQRLHRPWLAVLSSWKRIPVDARPHDLLSPIFTASLHAASDGPVHILSIGQSRAMVCSGLRPADEPTSCKGSRESRVRVFSSSQNHVDHVMPPFYSCMPWSVSWCCHVVVWSHKRAVRNTERRWVHQTEHMEWHFARITLSRCALTEL